MTRTTPLGLALLLAVVPVLAPPAGDGRSGLVETVDVSARNPPLASFGRAGFETVVVVGSRGCPSCRAVHATFERLPSTRARTRVVFADIGTRLLIAPNFESPFFKANRMAGGIPYVYFLDEKGTAVTEGKPAWRLARKLLPALPDQP